MKNTIRAWALLWDRRRWLQSRTGDARCESCAGRYGHARASEAVSGRNAFEIEFPNEDATKLRTVQDVIDYVQSRVKAP